MDEAPRPDRGQEGVENLSGLAVPPAEAFILIEAAMTVESARAEVRRARIAVREIEARALACGNPDDPEYRRGLHDVLRSAVVVERAAVEHLGTLART